MAGKKRYIVGDLYRATFIDHCTGDRDTPLEFEIVGWLVENKPKFIVLSNWKAKENWLSYIEKDVIIKSTITKLENLNQRQ